MKKLLFICLLLGCNLLFAEVFKDSETYVESFLESQKYIKIYCHGIVDLACEWILGQINTTLEEIAKAYEQSVPDPLKKYLL